MLGPYFHRFVSNIAENREQRNFSFYFDVVARQAGHSGSHEAVRRCYATIKVALLQVATCQLMSWGTVLMGEHHS
ncbi:hypothetical protein [Desulfosediminicola sp.]|uniref:hypothetical protein n=1 Tax=Desulfosediminicola sp. TaxID=2886825 RepID=UPI003AF2D5C1